MKRLFFTGIITLLLLVSCDSFKDEVAIAEKLTSNFTINNAGDSVIESQVLDISNNSTGATVYIWNFGNGTSCTDKIPAVSYPSPGNYTITLTTSNSSGETAIASHAITVLSK